MTSTTVSVIVPAYQAEAFLEKTLMTVAAQSVLPTELILVDDGSRDSTLDVMRKFARLHPQLRVLVLNEAHRGPGATRNAGIRAASSEWIAFLDADDLWRPEKIETMLAAAISHPTSNLFCHNEAVMRPDGSLSGVNNYGSGFSPDVPLAEQLYRNNLLSTSAVMCRRTDVMRVGGFDETLSSAQDYELWLRMSDGMKPAFVAHVLGTYVVRPGNISTTRPWRRLRNMSRVLVRHRHKVRTSTFVACWARNTIAAVLRIASALPSSILNSTGRRG